MSHLSRLDLPIAPIARPRGVPLPNLPDLYPLDVLGGFRGCGSIVCAARRSRIGWSGACVHTGVGVPELPLDADPDDEDAPEDALPDEDADGAPPFEEPALVLF